MKKNFRKFCESIGIFYSPRFITTIVYMLQNTEYDVGSYLKWFWRTQNFSNVIVRRTLDKTKVARQLILGLYVGMGIQILAGLYVIYAGIFQDLYGGIYFGLALLLSYPVVWAHLVVVQLELGRILLVNPRQKSLILASEQIFKNHPGIKIAVAGSYGKTSMKEILKTVLSEGKKVAATPANKNVAVSHAEFARSLNGNEDILLIEYGEGKPGDVEAFVRNTHPTHGVITGLAPAHLDHYKTLKAAGRDIFALAGSLKAQHVFVNDESEEIKPFIKPGYQKYNQNGAMGWKTSDIVVSLDGTSFILKKDGHELKLKSLLLGAHQVGPLSLVAALSHSLGLSDDEIVTGISRTAPFEHRMQPYPLSGGWVIDDTYNGNIEGIRAGTALLKALSAKRKLYVTPGLVDQGSETEAVHIKMGELIALSDADIVVLMRNSVSGYIMKGLQNVSYKGEVRVEDNPLRFYNNLGEFVAVGDVAMLQNDWPDNYA